MVVTFNLWPVPPSPLGPLRLYVSMHNNAMRRLPRHLWPTCHSDIIVTSLEQDLEVSEPKIVDRPYWRSFHDNGEEA